VAAEWEPGGVVIWESCRAGVSSTQGAGSLAGWWVWLSCTRMALEPAGQGSSPSTWSWSQAGPDGWGGGVVIPCVAGAQKGLKGSGLRGRGGYPGELWDQLQAGVRHRLVAGIPVVVGLGPRSRYG
jgi:hypothetical protein